MSARQGRVLLSIFMSAVGVMQIAHAGQMPVSDAAYEFFSKAEAPVAERVVIRSNQGDGLSSYIERPGILIKSKNAQANIVLCHGFMCDKYDVGFLRCMFPRGQYNFLTFDFRGHGENVSGQCCTFGRDEAHDVLAAAKFMRNHPEIGDKPLYAYGFSMGAVSAIEAQARSPMFDAMILDCPFDSSENVLRRSIDGLKISVFGYEFDMPGKSVLQQYAFHPYVQAFVKAVLKTVAQLDPKNIQTHLCKFCPAESAKKITVPCFFIHCKNDEKVPIDAVKSVYSNVAGKKYLWLTNGRHHFDSFIYNPDEYVRRVNKFLYRVGNGSIHQRRAEKIVEDT